MNYRSVYPSPPVCSNFLFSGQLFLDLWSAQLQEFRCVYLPQKHWCAACPSKCPSCPWEQALAVLPTKPSSSHSYKPEGINIIQKLTDQDFIDWRNRKTSCWKCSGIFTAYAWEAEALPCGRSAWTHPGGHWIPSSLSGAAWRAVLGVLGAPNSLISHLDPRLLTLLTPRPLLFSWNTEMSPLRKWGALPPEESQAIYSF